MLRLLTAATGKDTVRQMNSVKEALGKHYEAILNVISEGVLALSSEGTIVYANPAAVSIIDISEKKLLGSNFAELFSETDYGIIQKHLEKKENERQPIHENHGISFDQKQISLKFLSMDNEGQHATIVVLDDVSEQLRMEARIQRAQKMEAIGTLAGGVAHDLNNILSGLVSYPELLLLQLPTDHPLRKPIYTIQKAGEKAVAVVQDMLILARRGVVVSHVVNLNHVISEYLKSPEHEKLQLVFPKVHLQTRLAPNLFNISGSLTHLSKAVNHLISNAAEAMPEGGRMLVSTENRYVDEPIGNRTDVKTGDYVALTVEDSGAGISPDDTERIFEPFHTKKKMGRDGTGLGMAVVWGTVKDHKGYIHIRSAEAEGTAFTLYFPVTGEKRPESQSRSAVMSYKGNGESVLIVDDVLEQRQIASAMLKELGYSTLSVSSGEEAVKYLKTGKADLVVLDMIMDPGMDGLDTYRKIIQLHPGQKVIIASGFSETDRVREVQRLGAGAYVKKPFLLKDLGLAVKEELKKNLLT